MCPRNGTTKMAELMKLRSTLDIIFSGLNSQNCQFLQVVQLQAARNAPIVEI